MKLPGETQESFLMFRSFVPISDDDSKQKLTSFMVAKSDPGNYGQLQVFELDSSLQVDGPFTVNSTINATTAVSQQVTLLNQNGSTVLFGNLLLIPIDNSLLYVRPLYVTSDNRSNASVPELKKVIVAIDTPDGQKTEIADTLKQALIQLFPTVSPETFEAGRWLHDHHHAQQQRHHHDHQPHQHSTTSTTAPSGNATTDELVAQASKILQDAQTALNASCQQGLCDLTAYQQAVKKAGDLLAQAQKQSTASTTTTTTGTPA